MTNPSNKFPLGDHPVRIITWQERALGAYLNRITVLQKQVLGLTYLYVLLEKIVQSAAKWNIQISSRLI